MKQLIYLELDAILDTRIGCVDSIDPEMSKRIVKEGKSYWERKTDNFKEISPLWDHALYVEAYKNRGMETLTRSTLTGVLFVLQKIKAEIEKVVLDSPEVDGYGYQINAYPYRLNETEKEHLIIALRHYLGFVCSIDMVYIPYEKLTLNYIRSTYTDMYLYNFTDWISAIGEKVKEDARAPDVSMLVPSKYFDLNELPAETDYILDQDKKIGPFEMCKIIFSEFIGLEFIPIDIFSLPQPQREETDR